MSGSAKAGPTEARRSAAGAGAPIDAAEIKVMRVTNGFCTHCGDPVSDGHDCGRGGSPFDPDRYCGACGAKLTVQVLPHGVEAECLRCKRRARRSAA